MYACVYLHVHLYFTHTHTHAHTHTHICAYTCVSYRYICIYMQIYIPIITHKHTHQRGDCEMCYGVATISRLLKMYVSFAEYRLFNRALLQKRPVIWRSLLIVATPYCRTTVTPHIWAWVVSGKAWVLSGTRAGRTNIYTCMYLYLYTQIHAWQ